MNFFMILGWKNLEATKNKFFLSITINFDSVTPLILIIPKFKKSTSLNNSLDFMFKFILFSMILTN